MSSSTEAVPAAHMAGGPGPGGPGLGGPGPGRGLVSLRDGEMQVQVDCDRGAELTYVGTSTVNLLAWYDWHSPVAASRSAPYGDEESTWLSEYRGGWQALVPSGGTACTVADVRLPFHGEWSRTQVTVLTQEPNRLVVRAGMRLPLVGTRTIAVHGPSRSVRVEQVIHNEGATRVPYMWGEHPAFTPAAGARIHVPAGRVRTAPALVGSCQDTAVNADGQWPLVPGRTGGLVDLSIVPEPPVERVCYLPDLSGGWAVIDDGPRSCALAWDPTAYPHLWLWQEMGGPGFPWYGRTHITALEPQSAWPATGLASAIESGQARWLEPGETVSAWLTLAHVDPPNGVPTGVDREGRISVD